MSTQAALLCLLWLLGGCFGGDYPVEVVVKIEEGLELPEGASVFAQVNEHGDTPALREGLFVEEPFEPGTLEYRFSGEVCCALDPEVEFRGWLDLDGDGPDDTDPASAPVVRTLTSKRKRVSATVTIGPGEG